MRNNFDSCKLWALFKCLFCSPSLWWFGFVGCFLKERQSGSVIIEVANRRQLWKQKKGTTALTKETKWKTWNAFFFYLSSVSFSYTFHNIARLSVIIQLSPFAFTFVLSEWRRVSYGRCQWNFHGAHRYEQMQWIMVFITWHFVGKKLN